MRPPEQAIQRLALQWFAKANADFDVAVHLMREGARFSRDRFSFATSFQADYLWAADRSCWIRFLRTASSSRLVYSLLEAEGNSIATESIRL